MRNTNDNRFGENNPFFGKHHSNETRLKISEKMTENNPKSRKIIDNTGRVWISITKCAEELELNKNHLCSMLNGNKKFTKRVENLKLQYLD